MSKEQQLTDTVVMVRPDYFSFNPQTAKDNKYQVKTNDPQELIRNNAIREFETMVEVLEDHSLRVVVMRSPLGANGEITPDAVFPNNWFSTHPETLVLYPMKAPNRRLERQPDNLKKALLGISVLYPQTIDLTSDENEGLRLEGTGSLVLDRVNRIAYATLSQRTRKGELLKWCETMDYNPIFFHAKDDKGNSIYHTNVMMSVGDNFAVVCTNSIQSADAKEKVVRSLKDNNKEVVEISIDQKNKMCGNVLQTGNTNGQKLIIMSERARAAFGISNMKVLERHGLIVPVKMDQIETTGGGSARCMMAEIFYNK